MNDTEEAVRRLFAVATEDMPPGIDLLDRVRARSWTRVVRVRVGLAAGAATVLAAAAITLSAGPAPSALAQVTKAAAATAGQSYQVRSVATLVKEAGSGSQPPVTVSGEFDSAQGVGEETVGNGAQVRFAGGYMYLSLPAAYRAAYHDAYQRASGVSIPPGRSWLRFAAPLRPDGKVTVTELTQIGITVPDLGQVNPQDLLGLLESATQVSKTGPASGDGWTGTRYSFTSSQDFGGPMHLVLSISGTVDVDQQGRVRQLNEDYSIGQTERKVETTFGDFGLPVSVTAPPASEVFAPKPHGGTVGFGFSPVLSPSPSAAR